MENLLSMLAGSYPYAGCGNAPVSCMDERFRPEPLDYAGRSPRYQGNRVESSRAHQKERRADQAGFKQSGTAYHNASAA